MGVRGLDAPIYETLHQKIFPMLAVAILLKEVRQKHCISFEILLHLEIPLPSKCCHTLQPTHPNKPHP